MATDPVIQDTPQDIPAFDPTQPFEAVEQDVPAFDPNAPFEQIEDTPVSKFQDSNILESVGNAWTRGRLGRKINEISREIVDKAHIGPEGEDRTFKMPQSSILGMDGGEYTTHVDPINVESKLDELLATKKELEAVPKTVSRSVFDQVMASPEISEWDKVSAATQLAISDPSILVEMQTESFASSPEALLMTGLGSALGPVGFLAGSALGSMQAEEVNSIAQYIQEEGIDLNNADQLKLLADDPEMRERIVQRAKTRGQAVAATETLFSVITLGANKFLPKGITQKAAGFAAETLGEMTGELSAQVAADEDVSLSQAYIEGLSSAGKSAFDVTSAGIKDAVSTGNVKADNEVQAATQEEEKILQETYKDVDLYAELEKHENTLEKEKIDEAVQKEVSEMDMKLEEAVNLGEMTVEEAEATRKSNFRKAQAKFDPEVGRLQDAQQNIDNDVRVNDANLEESVMSGEISQEEAAQLSDEFKQKVTEMYNDPDRLKKAYTPTDIDVEYGKRIDSIPVKRSKDGRINKKQLEEVASIKKKLEEKGLNKDLSTRINKLAAKDVVSKLDDTGFEFNKSFASGQLGKIRAGLRNRVLNVKFLSNMNDKVVKIFDDFMLKPLEQIENKIIDIEHNETNRIQDIIAQNQLTSDDVKGISMNMWINDVIQDTQEERVYNAQQLVKQAANKVQDYQKTRIRKLVGRNEMNEAKKELKMATDLLARAEVGEELTLTPEQKVLKDIISEEFKALGERVRDNSKAMWDHNFELRPNYFRRQAIGGVDKNADMTEIQDFVKSVMEDEDLNAFNVTPNPAVYEGSMTKERAKDVSKAYFEMDLTKTYINYARRAILEAEGTHKIREIVSTLSDPKMKEKLGKDNVRALMNIVRSATNNLGGVRKADWVRSTDKMRTSILGQMIGTIWQAPKQMSSGVAQSLIVANPKNVLKAIKAMSKLDDDWFKRHAPNLYNRQFSLSHITLDDERKSIFSGFDLEKEMNKSDIRKWADKYMVKPAKTLVSGTKDQRATSSEVTSGGALSWADYTAAKMVFLADYLQKGGSLETGKVDKDKVRSAELTQQSLQNVNSMSGSGHIFNSENDLHVFLSRTSLGLMNFALQQMFTLHGGIRNMDTAEGRRFAMGAMLSGIGFHAASMAIRGIIDEGMDLAAGEDDEDDKDNWFAEDNRFLAKSLTRGIADAAMPLPVASDGVANIVNWADERYFADEDYDPYKDNLLFSNKNSSIAEDAVGPVTGRALKHIQDLFKYSADVLDTEKGATDKEVGLLTLEIARILNYSKFMPYRGDIDLIMRETQKRLRSDLREESKRHKKFRGRKNTGNYRSRRKDKTKSR